MFQDKYIIIAMAVLSLGAGWHGIAAGLGKHIDEKTGETADLVVLIVLSSGFVLSHGIIYFLLFIAVSSIECYLSYKATISFDTT